MTDKTRTKRTEEARPGAGCCRPENFKTFFEMMGAFCSEREDAANFNAMMCGQMEGMPDRCCRPERTSAETTVFNSGCSCCKPEKPQ